MSDRDADCARLAAAMGWQFFPEIAKLQDPLFIVEERDTIRVPNASAPLGDRMRFVGELAEALGCRYPRVTQGPHGWLVNLSDDTGGEAYDLAHAAVRAALVAKVAT